MASHGPLTCGNKRTKSAAESPQMRASAMPGTTAMPSSSAENAGRSCAFSSLAAGAVFFAVFFLITMTRCACPSASCRRTTNPNTVQIVSAVKEDVEKRSFCNFASACLGPPHCSPNPAFVRPLFPDELTNDGCGPLKEHVLLFMMRKKENDG